MHVGCPRGRLCNIISNYYEEKEVRVKEAILEDEDEDEVMDETTV